MSTQVISSGINAFNPSIVGGTGATYKIFPAPSLNFTAGTAATTPCTVGIPANGQFEGQRFDVTASGKFFVHGTSPTMLFIMQNGTSLTNTSNTTLVVLASALTGLTTNATYPWTWQTVFQGDSSSGVLQAVSSSLWINNATAGTVTLTGLASGYNPSANSPVNISGPGYTSTTGANALNLVIGIEYTVTDALNKAYMHQFQASL